MHDVAFDVRQAEFATLISVGQPFVVHAEQMKNRGVEIVYVDSVFTYIHSEVVGLSVTDSAFDPAAGQPHREGVFVMVTSGKPFVLRVAALPQRRSTKFRPPNNQCVFQQVSLLEIFQQRRDRSVGFFALGRQPSLDATVMIPSGIVQLDKPHAAFDQSSCQ